MTDLSASPSQTQASSNDYAYEAGWRDGYREAMAVLDEAGALLAELSPSRAIEIAAARDRRAAHAAPALSAQELRARAYASWGLIDPRGGDVTAAEPATGGAQTC